MDLPGPVVLVEPFGRGGGPDVIGRALLDPLSEIWGVRVGVENRPGDGATAAPAFVAASRPDGQTLLLNTSAHAYTAALRHDLPYDPIADFVAVAPLTSQPYVLVAPTASRIRTLDQLVAAARERPGQLRFASMGVGTGTHLGAEQLNVDLDVSVTHVPPGPTDSIAETMQRLVRGGADYALAPVSMVTAPLAAGELVPLGVSSARRSHLLPAIPTLAEAGAANFDFPIWYGTWAPANTPAEVVTWLRAGIADVLAAEHVQARLREHDAEPMEMRAVDFDDFIRREVNRARRIGIAAGVVADQ